VAWNSGSGAVSAQTSWGARRTVHQAAWNSGSDAVSAQTWGWHSVARTVDGEQLRGMTRLHLAFCHRRVSASYLASLAHLPYWQAGYIRPKSTSSLARPPDASLSDLKRGRRTALGVKRKPRWPVCLPNLFLDFQLTVSGMSHAARAKDPEHLQRFKFVRMAYRPDTAQLQYDIKCGRTEGYLRLTCTTAATDIDSLRCLHRQPLPIQTRAG
jgi:hypothetical protein